MRNPIVHALPIGATMTVTIDPPLADNEIPYIFAVHGPGAVVVRVLDSTHVALTNPLGVISPFAFFVGTRLNKPTAGWLKAALRMLGGFR